MNLAITGEGMPGEFQNHMATTTVGAGMPEEREGMCLPLCRDVPDYARL
jgi:hypothetical protein